MRITNLEIENFRGIKHCNISFPYCKGRSAVGGKINDTRILCLIGAGDNTKSTLLTAIQWIVYPAWNLQACDMDFYNCNTENSIVLRGTFAELPEKLIQEDKFGLYLRRPGVALRKDVEATGSGASGSGGIDLLKLQPTAEDDEPKDDDLKCLTIQLTIPSSLEPKWEVVCNRLDPKGISQNDRRLIAVANVGHDCGKDMVWGRYSILQRYADGANSTLHSAYTEALRAAAGQVSLDSLDRIAVEMRKVGQHYGVGFSADIKNKLLVQNSYYSASVGVFDGNVPLNQRGTGSQRLLSMGLNIGAFNGSTLLLVDEIESGLEPYRLRTLINELRATHTDCGQVIMTTHSPIAVAECTVDEIMVVRSENGETIGCALKTDNDEEREALQKEVRRNAEAFLSKRLIVCEGKTEQGIIRALDSFLANTKDFHMAYKEVGNADGGGQLTTFGCVHSLISCGYEVCLLMDSDKAEDEEEKTSLRNQEIEVFDWESPNSIEEQIFYDVPLDVAEKLMSIAVDNKGLASVEGGLHQNAAILYSVENDSIKLLDMDKNAQREIGSIAKKKGAAWFKRIDFGERVGNVIFENWDRIDQNTKLHKTMDALIAWVTCDD